MSLTLGTAWPLILAAVLVLAAAAALLLPRSRYRTLSAALRGATLLLLLLALSEPALQRRSAGIHTLYLLDASGSVPAETRAAAARFISASTAELAAPDTASVIRFGGGSRLILAPDSRQARIRAALSELREAAAGGAAGAGAGDATDLAAALEHARAELPAGGDRRVVILSDGIETRGNVRAAAADLREAGIRVSTVYLGAPAAPERRIASLRLPERVDPNDVFEITVVTESSAPGRGSLTIYRDGESLGSEEVTLSRGRNVFRYRDQSSRSGIVRYRAVLETNEDRLAENNRASAALQVGSGSRILYLRDVEEPRPFERALRTQDVDVVGRTPAELSATLTELSAYEAVIIDNVPAARFSLSRMNELERYVRQTGGGLVMLGGPSAFGAGGYFRTPVEQALPVSMDVTSTVRVPTLAMLFLVDKSGSMEASPGRSVAKLDIVKEAVLSSVEIMNPYHLVGLISFDADVERTVPITRAAERESIALDVARLRSGGGTVLATAMEEARAALQEVEAANKHVIILSDGLTRDADFRRLSRNLAADGVTVSTVSIGTDANRRLMEMIAAEGSGRSYHSDDTSRIPRIFTRETSIVARNVIVEEAFFPAGRSNSPLLAGIPLDRLPALEGFVLSYPKNSTRQLMDAAQGQPLLATWQYGLGRAAAFTSSIDGRWGARWAEWELLPRFAGQLVSWVQRPAYGGDISAALDRQGRSARLTVDVTDGGSRYVDGAIMRAALSRPDGTDQQVILDQVAPGRYEADMELGSEGVHILTVAGSRAAEQGDGTAAGGEELRIGPEVIPVSVPYPAEYGDLEPRPGLLDTVAAIGDGVSVSLSRQSFPQEDLPRIRSANAQPRRLWPVLLVLASLLFVGDILLKILRERR